MKKIIIIGGGASGMMAAYSASKSHENQVFLIEKNEKLGKKVYITGKGRCNLTNDVPISDFFNFVVNNGIPPITSPIKNIDVGTGKFSKHSVIRLLIVIIASTIPIAIGIKKLHQIIANKKKSS